MMAYLLAVVLAALLAALTLARVYVPTWRAPSSPSLAGVSVAPVVRVRVRVRVSGAELAAGALARLWGGAPCAGRGHDASSASDGTREGVRGRGRGQGQGQDRTCVRSNRRSTAGLARPTHRTD
jgi:hypothetical protein